MADQELDRQLRWPVAIGIAAIALGLLCNEWLLARLFSTDGRIALSNRLVIWAFTISAIATGLGLIARWRQVDGLTRRAVARHPNVAASVFGAFLCVALVVSVETLFWTLINKVNANTTDLVVHKAPSFRPGMQTTDSLRVGDETIYDVTYTLDKDYGRAVPGNPTDPAHTHVYLFGGSCTFGQGVGDDETLASYLVQETDGVRAFNYGFPGHGTAHMLVRLEQMEPTPAPERPEAIALYVFIPNHVKRTIGAMSIAATWGRDYPYYKPGPGGALQHAGTFTTGRPILSRVYALLRHEQVMKYFGGDLPPSPTDKHLAFTVRVISKSKRRFEELFHSDRFHVILYPMHPNFEFNPQRLIPFLVQAGIDYFDYTQAIDLNQEGFLLKHDLHPAGKTHRALAQRLAADLALQ